ncbi:MAG: ATPase, T2SS/T4P/T4SS family [Patescibacteria group bacterium]
MFLDKQKVENFILDLGLVSSGDLELAMQKSKQEGKGLFDVLIKSGKLTEDELREAQMRVSGFPFVDLENKKLEDLVLSSIPEPIARKFNIIAFERTPQVLKVAVLNLEDLDQVDFLKKRVALKIQPYLTNHTSINHALSQYQKYLREEYGAEIQKEFLAFKTINEEILQELPKEALLELARDKKISYVFDIFLKHALFQRASNIHIEPQEDNILVRYRIGEILYPAMVLPKSAGYLLNLKIKVLAGINLEEKGTFVNKRNSFHVGFDGKQINFGVHISPNFWGEKIILNILEEGDSGFSLEALGFHGKALDTLHGVLNRRKKMLLVAGHENGGKTTSFYTFLDLLRNNFINITTIENQIGFQMARINQIVLGSNSGLKTADLVKRLAKQDVDVLALDEVNDSKTMISLFGIPNKDFLNISVLETKENSCAKIISGLTKLEISSASIVAGLDSVVLQSLVESLLIENRKEYFLSVEEINKISKKANLEKVMEALVEEGFLEKKLSWTSVPFYKGDDSEMEKIMVAEVLKISPTIKELILENKEASDIHQQALKEGMFSLYEDSIFKAVQGLISVDKILK